MTIARARVSIVAVFLACLVVQAAAVILAYSKDAIAYGDLASLVTKLLAVYSVHLAVIFGGMFAQHSEDEPVLAPPVAFWLALVLAVMLNLLLAWRSVLFTVAAFDSSRDDSVEHLMSYIETISSASSFLVAGALTFFFAKK